MSENVANNFPLNFFVANPWAETAQQVDNSSWSKYNGLELEVNRRFSSLVFQGTYPLSKVLADTSFLTSQNGSQNFLSVTNRKLDRFRAGFDTTQSFAANFLYPLPFGRGKKIGGNVPAWANFVIGGFNLNGFSRWTTGAPLTITTGRNTTGSLVMRPSRYCSRSSGNRRTYISPLHALHSFSKSGLVMR